VVSRDGHLARFGELLSKAVGLHHADSLGATAIVTQRYPWLKTVPQPAVERDSPDLGRALRAPGSHAVQKRPTFTVRLRGVRHEPLRTQARRRTHLPLVREGRPLRSRFRRAHELLEVLAHQLPCVETE
jgi:hypothetical protein